MTVLNKYPILRSTPARFVLALLYTALLLVLLLQSNEDPFIPTGVPDGPSTLLRELFFGSVHLASFCVLTALWWWALITRWTSKQALVAAIVLGLAISLLTEWGQSMVPDRSPQLSDIAANFSGGLLWVLAVQRGWLDQVR